MTDFLSTYYLWIKSTHIISIISWMAGLLYLPRLFVYHAMTHPKSEVSNYFVVMERRLLRFIMFPAIILTFLTGFFLMLTPGIIDFSQNWFHVKLFLVFSLAGMHGFMVRWQKEFSQENRHHSSRFFRLANEIPTVLMVLIVILAMVKPF